LTLRIGEFHHFQKSHIAAQSNGHENDFSWTSLVGAECHCYQKKLNRGEMDMHVKKTILALAAGLLMIQGATAENYRWDNVAMGGGGFVTGIVTSKSERGVVYARTDVGGAYRYDSQNARWVPQDWAPRPNTGLMGVESLAIDPRNAANVYMLAGIATSATARPRSCARPTMARPSPPPT
jgi:hypothetical protein